MAMTISAVPRAYRWTAVALWMAFIFFMSAQADSGSQSGSLLSGLLALFGWSADPERLRELHFLLRKGAHLSEYALLGALLFWALPGHGIGRAATAWAIATGYAATDELHQAFVPNRGPAAADVLIDSFGALLAVALLRLGRRA